MTDIVRIIYYILFNGLIGTFSHYVTNNVIEIDSRMSHVDDLISFHKSLLIVFMLINDDIMITYQNHCVMAELRLYSQIIGNFRNFEKLFYMIGLLEPSAKEICNLSASLCISVYL